MSDPLVSIVLPTYNGEKYLKTAVETCLKQTYRNIELIIVDDCSKDSTPQIVKSFDDPRVRYVRNQTNQRLPRALNIGFQNALGDYLTWTSDDNLYMPAAIEEMLRFLQANGGDFVYADIYRLYENDEKQNRLERLPPPTALRSNNCVRACFLYTRRVMQTVGDYDPDMELIEDYDYWMRVSRNFTLHKLDKALYHYRFHDKSLWGSRLREIRMAEFLFKLKFDVMDVDNTALMIKDFMINETKNRIPLLTKLFVDLNFSGKIKQILHDYKMKGLSFTKTRLELYRLVDVYLK